MINKLAPGGIAVFMENITWPWRQVGKQFANPVAQRWLNDHKRQWEHGSADDREEWLEDCIEADLEAWQEYTPFIHNVMLELPVIGPEHYIYLSNRPIKAPPIKQLAATKIFKMKGPNTVKFER